MERIVRLIRSTLRSEGNRENSANYERYFKHVIRYHGLKTPHLKKVFAQIYKESIKPLPFKEQFSLARSLFESEFSEEKSFAIGILQKNLKKLDKKHLKTFEKIIDKHVYDWGTCDSLSGKVIGRMIKADPALAKVINPWKKAKCLWRQRAACVSFVNLARHGQHDDLIFDICSETLKNPERFAQLGTGWVLRELYLSDPGRTVAFIKENYSLFSREGLRYAIEKMPDPLRREMLEFGKRKG